MVSDYNSEFVILCWYSYLKTYVSTNWIQKFFGCNNGERIRTGISEKRCWTWTLDWTLAGLGLGIGTGTGNPIHFLVSGGWRCCGLADAVGGGWWSIWVWVIAFRTFVHHECLEPWTLNRLTNKISDSFFLFILLGHGAKYSMVEWNWRPFDRNYCR